MNKSIQIRNKILGKNQPLFITAEIGVTCNYDMKITKDLIDVVHDCNADAVKMIFWFPEEIMSDKSIDYTYETTHGTETVNMYEMLNQLRFSLDEWKELKSYADKKDVILFSTVNSPSGIQYAEEIGLEAYKLSSWDFNYFTLWEKISRLGKPMLIDSGPVNTVEMGKVMNLMHKAGNEDSVLVHCFHTDDYKKMNMRSIPYMQNTFDTLVGYSSANQDTETDIIAVTLGASYMEKRLTMDRNLPGHHHVLSLEPKEFENYVKLMRNVQNAQGLYGLYPSDGDLEQRRRWFRSLVANRDLKKGTVIDESMLEGKRPENGISPEYQDFFVGRTLKRDLKYNEQISWEDV